MPAGIHISTVFDDHAMSSGGSPYCSFHQIVSLLPILLLKLLSRNNVVRDSKIRSGSNVSASSTSSLG